MNSFSKILEKNETNFDYSDSLINVLYCPNKELNKRCVYKNHNDVIISYKDTIINKTIYVSSNGLKRNSVFTSEDFDKMLAKKELNTFVSYFKIFEDKFFRFDLYPNKYKKIIEINFIKNQGLIQKVNKRGLNIVKKVFRSKYINKHKFLNQKFTYNGSFDKKVLVKLGYREVFFLTSRGVLTPALEPRNYNAVTIMTGLFFIFKNDMKKMIRIIFISNYLLLRFFTKTFQNKNKNINLFINILVYYYFSKFTFDSFFEQKEELKINWKRSNKFIIRFFLRTQKKFNKFTEIFFQLSLNKYILKFTRPNYLNNLPLFKDENFFSTDNKYNSLSIKTELLPIDDKITIINYFIKILPLYLINVVNFKFTDLKNIDIYFLFKTLLLKDYLITKFNNLKLFQIKKIISYTNEIFLSKTLVKLNTYPDDGRCIMARRLYWVDLFIPPLIKVNLRTKVTSRYRRKVKKKFINKIFIQKSVHSPVLNQYLNNAFLKFYKLYISAKQTFNLQLTDFSYDLSKLMRRNIRKFKTRSLIKRKKVLKLFYRLLKKKKLRRYKKWKNNYRKWRQYLKIKKTFKARRWYLLKYPKKNRIFSFKDLLIRKLKLEMPKIVIPKITRVRRFPKQTN